MEKGQVRLIETMLISKTLSVKAIANSTGIAVDYILSIRKRLIKEGRLTINKEK